MLILWFSECSDLQGGSFWKGVLQEAVRQLKCRVFESFSSWTLFRSKTKAVQMPQQSMPLRSCFSWMAEIQEPTFFLLYAAGILAYTPFQKRAASLMWQPMLCKVFLKLTTLPFVIRKCYWRWAITSALSCVPVGHTFAPICSHLVFVYFLYFSSLSSLLSLLSSWKRNLYIWVAAWLRLSASIPSTNIALLSLCEAVCDCGGARLVARTNG